MAVEVDTEVSPLRKVVVGEIQDTFNFFLCLFYHLLGNHDNLWPMGPFTEMQASLPPHTATRT